MAGVPSILGDVFDQTVVKVGVAQLASHSIGAGLVHATLMRIVHRGHQRPHRWHRKWLKEGFVRRAESLVQAHLGEHEIAISDATMDVKICPAIILPSFAGCRTLQLASSRSPVCRPLL